MPASKALKLERLKIAVTRKVRAATLKRSDESVITPAASRSPETAAVALPIADVRTMASPAVTIAETTAANLICEFEEARLLALQKGQASAAVTATMAKARLAGLLTERPECKPKRATG